MSVHLRYGDSFTAIRQTEASSPLHTWSFPDGSRWLAIYRLLDGYIVRFPDLADFHVSTDGRDVECFPAPGATEATCQHLYLNQVLPMALSKQGRLVFHAGAVNLGEVAIAFVGESGRGKSTLTTSFATNGYGFLTDDGLMVNACIDGGHEVIPSSPAVRLWDDSQAALLHADAKTDAPLHYTTKSRFLADGKLPFCDQAKPLGRVYFLGEGRVDRLTIRELSPAEAMLELVKHTFFLDVEEKARLASHFDQVSKLASEPIHFALDYPRRYEQLPLVREALIAHARATGAGMPAAAAASSAPATTP